jgi:Type VI secretion system (T6SS), amidase effector protein 4
MSERHRIPISFARLVAAFPDHAAFPAPALLNSIGGQVRATVRDGDNTCAVRFSYMFNHAGAPIHRVHGDIFWREAAPHPDPATASHAHPTMIKDLFVIRAGDVKKYLTARFGAGTLIWDGYNPTTFKVPFRGVTQGIIVFEWRGAIKDFGATGHADLFRVLLSPDTPPRLTPACVGECYWMHGPMYAYLWQTNP